MTIYVVTYLELQLLSLRQPCRRFLCLCFFVARQDATVLLALTSGMPSSLHFVTRYAQNYYSTLHMDIGQIPPQLFKLTDHRGRGSRGNLLLALNFLPEASSSNFDLPFPLFLYVNLNAVCSTDKTQHLVWRHVQVTFLGELLLHSIAAH